MEDTIMEKKDLDWGNIGFTYMPRTSAMWLTIKTESGARAVWTADPMVVINESCGHSSVLPGDL